VDDILHEEGAGLLVLLLEALVIVVHEVVVGKNK
jgi:hypothetical protein